MCRFQCYFYLLNIKSSSLQNQLLDSFSLSTPSYQNISFHRNWSYIYIITPCWHSLKCNSAWHNRILVWLEIDTRLVKRLSLHFGNWNKKLLTLFKDLTYFLQRGNNYYKIRKRLYLNQAIVNMRSIFCVTFRCIDFALSRTIWFNRSPDVIVIDSGLSESRGTLYLYRFLWVPPSSGLPGVPSHLLFQ